MCVCVCVCVGSNLLPYETVCVDHISNGMGLLYVCVDHTCNRVGMYEKLFGYIIPIPRSPPWNSMWTLCAWMCIDVWLVIMQVPVE